MVLVLTVVLVSAAARAQSGVFVTFDAQQFTQDGYRNNPAPGSANVDRPWIFGPTYGIYFDVTHIPYLGTLPLLDRVKTTGPVVIGIDARGDTYRVAEYGSQLDRQDGTFNLRIAPKKPLMGRTTPYILGGFGIGHTRIPFSATYSNNFIYQVGVGADRKIAKHIDWRVVEARAAVLADYTVGAGSGPNQSNYLITVGTGLVFRLR
jgi:hypothetical protein